MMDFDLQLILFIGTMAAAAVMERRAESKLTAEQGRLVSEASSRVPWTLLGIAGIYGLHFWLGKELGHSMALLPAHLLALLLLIGSSAFLKVRRLRAPGLPAPYLRTVAAARAGTLVCMGMLFWSLHADITPA
ncbi:MAG: hypothetical protein ACO1TE_17090 [Prosthecobacter sp.]